MKRAHLTRRASVCGAAAMLAVFAAVADARATPIVTDFSIASNFAVLGLNSSTAETIHDPGVVQGNVGIPHLGSVQIGGGTITGQITFFDPVTGSNCPPMECGGHIPAPVSDPALIASAITQVTTAASAIHNATATQTPGALSGNITLTSSSDHELIRVSGNTNLTGFTLTLNGSASDYFFLDFLGTLTINNIVLTGGIDPTHVFFDIEGTGANVLLSQNNANFFGYFLVPNGEAHINGSPGGSPNGLHGGVYGAGSDLTIDTEGNVYSQPSGGGNQTGVPEPGTLLLLGTALGCLGLLRRRVHRI